MIKNDNSINEFLNEVNNKVRLSDFISQFVNLNEKGNSFVGKCPFHNENTPSFNVSNDKSLFYCFGCKTGGNILNFISKYKNLQFKEAVNYVSNYSGIPFLFDEKKKKINTEEKLILDLLRESNDFFNQLLKRNTFAYKYIKSRGVSEEVISTFKIGFAPDYNILIKYLVSKGFSLDQIKKTDLLIKNKQNEFFGRFSNRITFPIYDFNNNIVGFGGRSINKSKIKYINSQENVVFKKSQILYGLHQNLEHVRNKKEVYLVEGYMDVIKLYCSDIKNVVSSLGTTLSETQLQKMWNFTDIPFVCFDGDQAGINASKIISEKVLKFLVPGKSLKFIQIPDNNDPDSYMQENKKDDFLGLKTKSKDLSEMIWDNIKDSIKIDTPEFLAVLDEKINNIVSKIQNPKISKEYLRFLRSKKDSFIWQKNRIKSSKFKKSSIEVFIENINEKIFLQMIISDKEYVAEFQEEIFQVKLFENTLENIKNQILENFSDQQSSKTLNISDIKVLYPKLFSEINELEKIHIKGLKEEEKKIFFKQILNNLRLPYLVDERKIIQKEIIESSESVISENLLKRYNKISDEIRNIRNKDLE